ncbi:MAG: hypothetical protein CL859_02795 [Cyanobium sp. ARS6]|uniref:hypothetical protein n=1 Tax=Synechococcus sp. MIT S9507 TaxID=3082544 RepID=UPI000C396437|nr:hypothetical protein [Cyanobium sp. ARS6]
MLEDPLMEGKVRIVIGLLKLCIYVWGFALASLQAIKLFKAPISRMRSGTYKHMMNEALNLNP